MNLIYQVYVGNNNSLYDICCKSVNDYARRIGAEHIIQRDPILKIRPVNSHRSVEAVERLGYLPIYEKENAFDLLNAFDNILILDSDIFVKSTAPDIFNEIESYDFAGVVEREMPITKKYAHKIKKYSDGQYRPLANEADFLWNELGAEFFNMGLMLCNKSLRTYLNNETAKQFITRKEFERFVNGEGAWKWSTDQTLLNFWIKKYKINSKHLSWKWNALYRGIEDNLLKDAYFVHFFLSNYIEKPIDQVIKEIS